MRRVPRLGLLHPCLGILTPLLRLVPQGVQLAVHARDLGSERVDSLDFFSSKGRVLAVLLRLFFAFGEDVKLGKLLVASILLFEVLVEFLLTAETDAVAVAVTRVHGGAVDFVAGEDVVPYVFEDAAGELVVHAGGEEPLAVVDEALDGDFLDALARDGELCAADSGYRGWDGRARVDLLPDVAPPVYLLGLVEEVKVAARAVHVYPVGAAGVVVAAHVHVAHARDSLVVEALDHLGGVKAEEHVVVPCVTVGVHEDGRVGEVIVVVDDVGEVDLVSFSWWLYDAYSIRTMASRPLFLGILCSALGLSTSYTTRGASGISLAIQLMSSFCVLGTMILYV
jgi:hypothetical protein